MYKFKQGDLFHASYGCYDSYCVGQHYQVLKGLDLLALAKHYFDNKEEAKVSQWIFVDKLITDGFLSEINVTEVYMGNDMPKEGFTDIFKINVIKKKPSSDLYVTGLPFKPNIIKD